VLGGVAWCRGESKGGRWRGRERAGVSEKWSGRTRGDNGLLRPGAARRIRAAVTRGQRRGHAVALSCRCRPLTTESIGRFSSIS